jgi:hypothetical protein
MKKNLLAEMPALEYQVSEVKMFRYLFDRWASIQIKLLVKMPASKVFIVGKRLCCATSSQHCQYHKHNRANSFDRPTDA